jgi:hypothetical protein
MSNFTLKSLVAASLLLVGANSASAGTDAVRAEAFFNAISGGNADTVASFYADKAEFHWVGGPLAGIYKGKGQIKGVWEKFGQAAGKLDYKTLDLSESQNGPISTVTARVKFIGPKEVPVKFVLMFKDGKIVNQIWQVDKGEGYAAKVPEKAPAPAAKPAQQAEAPKAEQPAQVASAPDEAAERAPAAPEAQNAPNAPEGAPEAEAAEGAPEPDGREPNPTGAQAQPGATPPGAEARGEPVAPPPGAAPPTGAAPKKYVKKVEKKKKYEPEYYDEDYYDYHAPRGHYGYRHHRGYGYGRGSGHGGY